MLSVERLTGRRNFPLIGSFASIQALFEQASQKSQPPTQDERVASNFLLIDTLTSELVKAQIESPLDLETERRQKLKQTIFLQLEAALREHLRTPYHTDANEIDWDKFAAGKLHVFHRSYHQKDLRDHCQDAIEKSTGAKQERYRREKNQMDVLYTQHILPELENFSSLTPSTAGFLSWEVQKAYGLSAGEEVFVGKKYGLVMPANLPVYPDGFSYVNIHQLIYIPRLRKILVTIDQFFTELSYDQHKHILNSWKKESVQGNITEDLLMKTIIPLPEETRKSAAFSVFMDVAQSLEQNQLNYQEKQQYSHSFVSHSRETLTAASAFLTHILLLEYQISRQFPQSLSTLSQRLQVAFEMAAHPLLSGQGFHYQASLQSYTQQFLQPWLSAKTKHYLTDEQLYEKLQDHSFIHQARSGERDSRVENQRNKALLQLSQSYPNILNGFLSQAQCAAGSIGGLSKMAAKLQSPLGARILSGHNASFSEVQQMLGARAERFSRGTCVNPQCRIMKSLHQEFGDNIPHQHLPYVGECRLCLHCELQYQASRQKNKNPSANSLKEFGGKTFANSTDAAQEYLRIFGIQPDLLGTFFLAEEWATRQ